MLGDILKIDVIDNNYVIYLNKLNLINFNFDNQAKLEEEFKKLFKILRNNYDLKINGYYNIKIYQDKYYGMILEINKENIDYYDYFDYEDTIAMRIKKYDIEIFYKVEDFFFINQFLDHFKLYIGNNNIYLKIIKEIDECNFFKLLEMSKINYNNKLKLKEIKVI